MNAPMSRRSVLMLAAATGLNCAAGRAFAVTTRGFTMPHSVRELCERYYDAWQHKNLQGILGCVHPQIAFKSPNATTQGRDAYAAAARRFLPLVDRVEVRKTFTDTDAAMVAVDFHCIQPVGPCPTAERMKLRDGLIVEDELYFDPRPFEALARARAAAQAVK